MHCGNAKLNEVLLSHVDKVHAAHLMLLNGLDHLRMTTAQYLLQEFGHSGRLPLHDVLTPLVRMSFIRLRTDAHLPLCSCNS